MFQFKKKQKAHLKENHSKVKKGSFDFSKIEKYFLLSPKENVHQVIPDKTCLDLDLDELFMFIDRTTSNVGQQYLYNTLRTIPKEKKRSDGFEELISIFSKNDALKYSVLHELSKLNKKEAYYITSLFLEDHIEKPKWFWLIQVLSLASFTSIILAFIFPQFVIVLLLLLAVNYTLHYWNKRNLFQYGSSIPQLLILNGIAKKLGRSKVLADRNPRLNKFIKTIDSIGYQMSVFKFEAMLQGEIGLIEHLFEIIKALLLIEPILLFHVLKNLDSKREQIHEVFKFVGEIDVAISISSLRNELPYYTRPTIIEKKKALSGNAIYHPLLDDFVSNSIELLNKSALLTGSNMSGKTTFIRTIGINVITAQTIHTCFAKEFIMPQLKVYSAIRISDDLMREKSYYFEEVLTIKEILEASRSDSQNLILLDELYKGTNTIERIAAGKSVLNYLNNKDNVIFVSTHDVELAEYLKETYNLYHFTEIVKNGSILFDYRIKSGSLTITNAIRILELNNYPLEVIREAKELSKEIRKIKMTNT